MDREAKRRRKEGIEEVYGPNELKKPRISLKEAGRIWLRPFEMFVREPIVLCLSLLSGFSDAIIFIFLEGFSPVYDQWSFNVLAKAWAFIPINLAYFLTYFSYLPWIWKDERTRKVKGSNCHLPERRLKWLLWVAPLEPIGLMGFAWTSLGPSRVHWIAPMIFSCLIGIANYAIYFSSVDYMIAAYGVYSASACGGSTCCFPCSTTSDCPHSKQKYADKYSFLKMLSLGTSSQEFPPCLPSPCTPTLEALTRLSTQARFSHVSLVCEY